MVNPKKIISAMAAYRKTSGEIPVARTNAVRVKVKKTKLVTSPRTMPQALEWPCPILAASSTGSMGRMQGESTVTHPARAEKSSRKTMALPIDTGLMRAG